MFSETIRYAARGHSPGFGVLCEMLFLTKTMHVHNGGGLLSSRGDDGEMEDIQWMGLQGLATVSNLGASKIGASRQVTATLTVDDDFIKETFADQGREIRGRKFRFWGQFYDADMVPLDPKFHIYTGTGDRLRMTKQGPSSRRMELMLEDMLVRRKRTAYSMVTHSDQQARDPGNIGFIFVQKMVDQSLSLFDARN